MAKRFSDFNKVYAAVLENAKRAAIVAAKETAKQISRDMHQEALKTLKYYYADYDPDYYDRTYNLRDNSLTKIYEDNSSDSVVDIIIGEKFSDEKMSQYMNKKKTQSKADADWVVDNFLKGEHPNTGYDQIADRVASIMMNKFIDEKVEKLRDKYMNSALLREFTKRMK